MVTCTPRETKTVSDMRFTPVTGYFLKSRRGMFHPQTKLSFLRLDDPSSIILPLTCPLKSSALMLHLLSYLSATASNKVVIKSTLEFVAVTAV